VAKKESTEREFIFDKVSKEEAAAFKLDTHLVNLMIHEPFFSTIIRNMDKIKSEAISTAGVAVKDLSLSLYWNPYFLASLKTKQVRELLKHECYHIIFNHCVQRRQEPHIMWNIATDLAINSILDNKNLPEGGLVPGQALDLSKVKDPKSLEKWKKLSDAIAALPTNKASEWYFGKLMNDPELKELVEDCYGSGEPGDGPGILDDHEGWGDLTDEQRQIMEGKVKEIVKDAVKRADSNNSWGSVPSDTRSMLRKLYKNSVDWKKLLRNFIGRSQRMDKSNTHKKINRKYPYIHPGVKRKHTATLAIYIDQSGSVRNEEVEIFFGALSALSKKVSFHVYPFDYGVDEKNSFRWRRRQNVEPIRTRSGGTCFESVEQHFRKVAGQFDGYLVLTDGGAPKPSKAKKRRCWVVLPGHSLYFEPDRNDVVVQMELPDE